VKHSVSDKPRIGARQEAHLRRQEEILDRAAELFARYGYFDTDTQFLADQLNVGKGTLYRYFPSKEDLFLAAVDRVMRKLHEQIVAFTAGIEDPVEQIRRGIHGYLSFYAEHPEFVELLVQERALFRDRKKPTYLQHREVNELRWQELYRSLIVQGRIREMPVKRITDVIGDLLYGTICTNCFSGQTIDAEAQARGMLDVLLHGILREPHARPTPPTGSLDDQ
jgi:AcrR family transcriptional regulator